MTEFNWTSPKPLQGEVIARAAAFAGLLAGPAIAMFILNYVLVGSILLMIGIIVAIVVARTTGTKIWIDGDTLHYGTSHELDLRSMKGVRIIRQFGIEEVLVVDGAKGSGPIPMRGVPKEVRAKLIEALNERVTVS
jgi:hypothetical protein